MNAAIDKVIHAIAEDMTVIAQLILESDNVSVNKKTGINTLANSNLKNDISSTVSFFGDGQINISAVFNYYIDFLEWDRPPEYGKSGPPIDVLREWALSHDVPTDNSTLFAISRAIWRDGHKGRPILLTLGNEMEDSFNAEYYEKIFDAIIDELTNFFE